MDNRLFQITSRPSRLRRQDLPLVARALVSLYRRQAKVETGFVRNIGYVLITASDFKVQILASDWAKILPRIQDESFNQVVTKSQVDSVYIDPLASHASSIIDHTDREYYLRVLYTLQALFSEAYPTSNR